MDAYPKDATNERIAADGDRAAAAAARTSLEKLDQLSHDVSEIPAEGPEAMLLLGVSEFMPLIRRELPDDPDELDDVLDRVAAWLLTLRSDGATAAEITLRVVAPLGHITDVTGPSGISEVSS